VAGGLVWLVLAGIVLPIGQGVASTITLSGWVWPRSHSHAGAPSIVASIGGLLRGHPGVDLTATQAQALPAAAVVYLVIVVLELALAAGVVWLLVLARRHLVPAMHGMAGRDDAEQVLGVSRLRRSAAVIRPDRHDHTYERS
jgi:hypothetical protein